MQELQAVTGRNVFWRKTIWWLLVLFVVSAAVRIPNLNRSLSKHHEFCTALTLIIVQSWNDEGISARHFNPSTTFSLPADKFINNCSMDTMQRNGNFYYLSHPPLAYYVPYAVFKILQVDPSPLALQILNLVFEFITVVFVYLTTALLAQKAQVTLSPSKGWEEIGQLVPEKIGASQSDHHDQPALVSIPALIAASIYLFLPITLWFHSNAYMADMFVQNLWAPALFITLRIFLERKEKSSAWLIAFAFSIFLMTYTDWPGALFSGTVFLSAVFRVIKRRKRSFIPLAVIAGAVPVFTVMFVLIQYASINGWGTLMYCYRYRYAERGSLNWNHLSGLSSVISQVGLNYIVSYTPVLPLLVVLFFKWKSIIGKFPVLKLLIWLTLFPVLLDHLLFLRYAVQDFAVLKASFFISITSAVALCTTASLRVPPNGGTKQSPSTLVEGMPTGQAGFGLLLRNTGGRRALLVTVFICLAGIAIYYYVNRPGPVSLSGERYDTEQKIGEFISAHAKPDEVVFLKGADVSPQMIHYAHRNIREVSSEWHAKNFLSTHPAGRGILVKVTKDSLTSIPVSE